MAEKLTNADIHRYYELDTLIKSLTEEQNALKLRFKTDIPEGTFDSPDGAFEVKRWTQLGALDTKAFLEAYSSAVPENALFFENRANLDAITKNFPPEEFPEFYTKVPNEAVIKEVLDDEEKAELFKQTPYLKIAPTKK